MTLSGVLVSIAICGALCCSDSPSSPSGMPLIAQGRVTMIFTPQDQTFASAAEEYQRVWLDEGSTIVAAMERVSALTFRENQVNVVVFEGVSRSGSGNTPMYLRASYPPDVKKATLVHELGHRLIAQLTNRPADLDEHRVLDLLLYDIWETLWGKDFADRQVVIESGRTGLYDYAAAWRWALSLSKGERAARFAAIMRANGR
jgi:hypothetical protein